MSTFDHLRHTTAAAKASFADLRGALVIALGIVLAFGFDGWWSGRVDILEVLGR